MYRIEISETILLISLKVIFSILLFIIPGLFSMDANAVLIYDTVIVLIYTMILWNISKIIRKYKMVARALTWIIRIELLIAFLTILIAIKVPNSYFLYPFFSIILFVFYIILIVNILRLKNEDPAIKELRPFIYILIAISIVIGSVQTLNDTRIIYLSPGWIYSLETVPYFLMLRYFIVLRRYLTCSRQ